MYIRNASIQDLPALQNLYTETIRSTCKNDYTEEQLSAWTSTTENRERWVQALSTQYFLVAEIDGRLAGFGSLSREGYLDFLYVHPGNLRQGVANGIFHKLLEEARQLGLSAITSDVSKTARPFFENKGFEVMKKNQKSTKGVVLVNFRMQLELTDL